MFPETRLWWNLSDSKHKRPAMESVSEEPNGMKDFAKKLKVITDNHGIIITPRNEMPQDKRIKETKKIVKRIVKK